MRKALNGMKADEAVENILNMFVQTKNNKEFVEILSKNDKIYLKNACIIDKTV